GSTAGIQLAAVGALTVSGSVSTVSSGVSGNVSLSGSSVTVSGSNSSVYTGASINTASRGNNGRGGAVDLLSYNGSTAVGSWVNEALVSGGNIYSSGIGSLGAAGEIAIVSLGRTRINDAVALGENNSVAGGIGIQSNAGGMLGSLSVQ